MGYSFSLALLVKMSLDKEPERYYDWILWKLRQEKKSDMVNTSMEMDAPYVAKEEMIQLIGLDCVKAKLNGIDNEKIKSIVYDNANNKFSDNPNNTGIEDSRLPDGNEYVENMKTIITRSTSTYLQHSVKLLNIWAHIVPPNGSTNYHHHRGEYAIDKVCSVVYYVDVPENSGDLIFMMNVCNVEFVKEVKSEEDHLVIFPSFIPHMTGKNKSDRDRISISANFLVGEKNV